MFLNDTAASLKIKDPCSIMCSVLKVESEKSLSEPEMIMSDIRLPFNSLIESSCKNSLTALRSRSDSMRERKFCASRLFKEKTPCNDPFPRRAYTESSSSLKLLRWVPETVPLRFISVRDAREWLFLMAHRVSSKPDLISK